MRAVPRLVEVELPVERLLAEIRKQCHAPAQQRPAVGSDDRHRHRHVLRDARGVVERKADLLDMVGADGAAGGLPRRLHRRQEEADEHRRHEHHHPAEDDPGERERLAGEDNRRTGALARFDLAQPHHAADQPGDPGEAEKRTGEHAEHEARQCQATLLRDRGHAGRSIVERDDAAGRRPGWQRWGGSGFHRTRLQE